MKILAKIDEAKDIASKEYIDNLMQSLDSTYQPLITSTNKLAYSLISGTPDLSVYLTTSSASSTYQPKITSSAKLAASLISGLATVATSGSYNDLSDKPTIPTSLKNPYALSWSGYSSGSYDGSAAKSITIPTNTNQLTNGAGFITSDGFCLGVRDYNATTSNIKIGFTGNGLTASTAGYLAAYGTNSAGERVIKDISKAEVQSWLGLGSNAYNSTAYLPLSGGTLTGTLKLTNLTEPNGNGLLCYHPTDWGGVTSSQWAVGTGDSQGVIRSSNTNLLHYKGDTLYTIWDSGNDGSGSGLDADLLDGTHKSGLSSYMLGHYNEKILAANTDFNNVGAGFWGTMDNAAYTNSPFNANFGIISMTLNSTYLSQLALPYSPAHNIRYRNQYYSSGRVWSDWKTIAFTTDNVASATKLQTARTIWGQSFDGTGDITGQLNITSSLYGGMTQGAGALCIGPLTGAHLMIDTNDIQAKADGTTPTTLYINDWGGNVAFCSTSGNVGIGTTNPTYKLSVNGSIYINGNLSSNYYYFNDVETNPYLRLLHSGSYWYVQAYNGYMYLGVTSVKSCRIDSTGNFLSVGGITSYSDIRKKEKLQDVQLTLKQIADAPLIEHYYKHDDKKTTHVGSIAQYWAGMNDWFCKMDSEGYYTMEIQNAALASAISIARELVKYESKTDRTIRLLKKRINQLEDEIENLKKGA